MKILMDTPTNCPFCGDPLCNDFLAIPEGITLLTKRCDKKTDHSISIRACNSNYDYVDLICVPYSKDTNALWHMGIGQLAMNNTSDGKTCWLPFFMPNLTNYTKLIEKLKVLLVMR